TKADLEARAAFQQMPAYRQVPASADAGTAPNLPLHTSDSRYERAFVFHDSAFFPQLGFRPDGAPIEWDPAIIYEGMRVVYRNDGTYSVHFTITVPNTPVRLRLQLRGYEQFQFLSGWTATSETFVLTLPPINLKPSSDELRDPRSRTYQVLHEGYSERIKEIWNAQHRRPSGVENRLVFTRSGTARFGSLPEPAK